MDGKSWITGDKFKGIKLIPPGLHYFTFSLKGKHGEVAPIAGNFFLIKPREVIIRKWSAKDETLLSQQESVANTAEVARFAEGALVHVSHQHIVYVFSFICNCQDFYYSRLTFITKFDFSFSSLLFRLYFDFSSCSSVRV